MLFRVLFACLVGMASVTPSTAEELHEDLEAARNCGLGCIYGVLKLNKIETTKLEIEDRLEALFPHEPVYLSLDEICVTLQSYGLRARVVRVPTKDILSLPCPSILYLRPDKVGNSDVGHAVLHTKSVNNAVEVVDFSPGVGKKTFDVTELSSFWDGELIAVGDGAVIAAQRLALFFVSLTLLAIGSLLIVGGFFRQVRHRFWKINLLLLGQLFACVVLIGCGRDQAGSPLSVEDGALMDFGVVVNDGERLRHSFRIKAWDKSDVVIERVRASCGCLFPSESLSGKTIKAGEEFVLPVEMNVSGRIGPVSGMILLDTLPQSQAQLALELRATAVARTSAIPSTIRAQLAPNGTVEFSYDVTRLRLANDSPLQLDAGASNFAPFEIVSVDTDSTQRTAFWDVEQNLRFDKVTITLRSENAELDDSPYELKTAFIGEQKAVQVNVHLRSEPDDVQVPVDRVFLGSVAPDTTFAIRVPLSLSDGVTDLDVECSLEFITVAVNGEELHVKGKLPRGVEGRFEGEILISYRSRQDTRLSMSLPVSGLVLAK